MKTPKSGATCALALALLAPSGIVWAQPVAPTTTVTEIAPDPGTPAPRIVVPAQTEALQDALKKNDWDAATLAIKGGAEVNLNDKNGVTVLMRAAEAGKTSAVQFCSERQSGGFQRDIGQPGRHFAAQ